MPHPLLLHLFAIVLAKSYLKCRGTHSTFSYSQNMINQIIFYNLMSFEIIFYSEIWNHEIMNA